MGDRRVDRRRRQVSLTEGMTLFVVFIVGILGAMLGITAMSRAATDAGVVICVVAVLILLGAGASLLWRRYRSR